MEESPQTLRSTPNYQGSKAKGRPKALSGWNSSNVVTKCSLGQQKSTKKNSGETEEVHNVVEVLSESGIWR